MNPEQFVPILLGSRYECPMVWQEPFHEGIYGIQSIAICWTQLAPTRI